MKRLILFSLLFLGYAAIAGGTATGGADGAQDSKTKNDAGPAMSKPPQARPAQDVEPANGATQNLEGTAPATKPAPTKKAPAKKTKKKK